MKTVGRWPWRLASVNKRVITYLSNLGLSKMDDAYLQNETLSTKYGRLACSFWRSQCLNVDGGDYRADLGSSSILMSMQRRVHPLKKEVMRRL